MKTITEKQLEKGFDLAISDLKKDLEKSGQTISKGEVLEKARKAFQDGKIDLVESGNIERKINRNIPLSKAHRAALGLQAGARIQGLDDPKQSSVEARMGSRPGAKKTDMGTGTAPPVNSIADKMLLGQKLSHSYQAPGSQIVTVTGAEVLRKCQELIRAGKMTLNQAGDIERAVNTGLPIRPELLRFIFNE